MNCATRSTRLRRSKPTRASSGSFAGYISSRKGRSSGPVETGPERAGLTGSFGSAAAPPDAGDAVGPVQARSGDRVEWRLVKAQYVRPGAPLGVGLAAFALTGRAVASA